jgi:PAS domain S-box-containing protein
MADIKKSLDQLVLENEELKLRLAAKEAIIDTFRENENKYAAVYNSMSEGLAIHELIYDSSGKAIDYLITDINLAYEKITGLKKNKAIGRKATELYSVSEAPYINVYSEVESSGIPQTFETYFPPMDKHFHISVFSPSKGKFATVFQDISERKRNEEALKRSEQLYRAIGESIDYGIWICDAEGKNTYASESYLKLVGLTQEQCSEFGWGNTLHPDDAERTIAAWKECSKTGGIWDIEHRFRGVDGKWHPILARGVPVRDENGNIISWAGINLDISKIKQTEEALRKSEERYRQLFNSIIEGFCIIEMIFDKNNKPVDYRFLEINNVFEKQTGLRNAKGRLMRDLAPDIEDYWFEIYGRIALTGEIMRFENEAKALNRWFEVIAFRTDVPEKHKVAVCFNDITQRKLAEEALRHSEEQLRVTLTSIGDAVITVDTSGKVNFLNPVAETLTGWKPEEAAGQSVVTIFRIINELTQEKAEDIVQRVLREGHVVELSNHTALVSKDGRQIPIEDSAAPIKDSSGKVIGVVLVFHDVTEKRLAQEALQESEERFRNLVKNAPTAIYEIDFITRKFTSVNDSMCTLSGYSREELLSSDALDLLDEDSKKLFLSRISKSQMGEKPEENVEYRVKAKDGRLIDAVLNMKFNFNDKGIPVGAMVVGHDITERKKAEADLREIGEALKVSERRFRTLTENIPDMIVRFDRDLRLIYGNEAVLERTGLSLDFLTGKTAKEYGASSEVERNWEKAAREVINTGNQRRLQLENVWQGISKVYDSLIVPEKDNVGNVSSIISIARDITEMKKSENILRSSEQRLKYHLENSPLAVVEWDKEFNIVQWSNEAERIFGMKRDEVIGVRIDLLNIIYPEDIPVVEKTMSRLNSGKELKVVSQNRNITKKGKVLECIWYNSVLLDEKGEMSSVMSLVEDVTLLHQTELQLKESESKLRSVLDATQESIYMFDREGKILMSNSTGISRLRRRTEDELVGHHISEFISPELTRARMERLNEVFESGNQVVFEDERESRYYLHNFFPILKDDKVVYTVTYSTDITESKNAETKIKQSEDRFRTIAESLTIMVSITKISDSTITFINEPFEKSFGYKKSELVGTRMHDIYYYPDDNKFLIDSLKVRGLVENVEVRVKMRDGTPFWIMTSIRKINYMNEPSYLAVSTDISEIKKAQDELLRLNRTLDAQSKSSQAMMRSRNEQEYLNEICKIIIEDCGHAMVWVGYAQNDARKSVKPVAHFGFDRGYIEQMNITWDDSERGSGPTGTAIRTGKPSICRNMLTDPCFGPWREAAIKRGYSSSVVLPLKSEGKAFGAISIYSKDPDPFTESEVDLLTELADDLAYGILFIRLTEYEKEATRAIKENEIRLKELIATKDKFFNIIAHDLKNPFTSLLGASELLYDNITQMSAENVKKLALILNDSAKGGYSILQNLLDWSRSQTGQLKFNPENVNLKSIIDENIDNLQLQVNNKEISLISDLRKDLFITADKNMINTVLRNLLSNAVKYTFKDGVIRVSVTNYNGKITVTVKDTGVGISKEKADSLFKLENSLSMPGTAKEQGTGLGLKLCKEFTEKMGGKIWVESEVGKGSKFNFTIPIDGTKV